MVSDFIDKQASAFVASDAFSEVWAVDLVQLDAQTVEQVQGGYRVLAVVAEWLPWLLLLLPALALFLARDLRRTVVAWVAVTIGILAAWLAFKIVAAQGMAVAARSGFSEAATTAIFDGALGPMKGPALALAIVGMVIAILAWVTAQGAEES